MSRIVELREKQARIHAAAQSKLNEITNTTEEARAAEINREFDTMLAEFDQIGAQIEREEKLDRAKNVLNQPDPRRPNLDGRAQGQDDDQPVTYREAFADYLRSAGDMSALRPEARAVLQKGFEKIEAEQRAQTAGTGSQGGFTVPTELQAIMVRAMKDWGPMYDEDICTVITTAAGNSIPLPFTDDTAKVAAAQTEGVTLTDDGSEDVVFAQRALDSFSASTEWLRVSYELVNDSLFNMEQLLGSLLGERLGRRANAWLTVGTGTGQPNGIVTASTLGVTAASATAFTSDEVMGLMHSVDPAYRRSPKCRWMFHDNIMLAIRRLKDGQGNYLWQMGDVRTGQPDTLLGKPYSVNQDMANTQAAAARIIAFGDFSKYFVRKAGQPLIGAIQDKDFWPGFGIAGYIRVDGELADPAAVKYLRNL
jgi:HK97 family phage major capsid protein